MAPTWKNPFRKQEGRSPSTAAWNGQGVHSKNRLGLYANFDREGCLPIPFEPETLRPSVIDIARTKVQVTYK